MLSAQSVSPKDQQTNRQTDRPGLGGSFTSKWFIFLVFDPSKVYILTVKTGTLRIGKYSLDVYGASWDFNDAAIAKVTVSIPQKGLEILFDMRWKIVVWGAMKANFLTGVCNYKVMIFAPEITCKCEPCIHWVWLTDIIKWPSYVLFCSLRQWVFKGRKSSLPISLTRREFSAQNSSFLKVSFVYICLTIEGFFGIY